MHCDQISEQFADYLAGTLSDEEKLRVESHLSTCADCQSAISVWQHLGSLPLENPRPEMKARFQDFLWSSASAPPTRVAPSAWKPSWQWAAAAALLVCGWFSGRYIHWTGSQKAVSSSEEVASLRNEVHHLREAVILSMLRQESASDRLKAVLTSTTLKQPDASITTALIETLQRDPNVNVRLATIDALRSFSGNQQVRSGMADGLSIQDSPLVQVALIDALVELQAKQVVPVLQQMETNEEMDQIVRQKARLALETFQ